MGNQLKEYGDFHTHTTFSDGKNTPEEMILSAIEKGMPAIGFSDHAYTYFDESYCMKKNQIDTYRDEIAALKAKYANQIAVFCGIEQDYYSLEETASYDYVIGSAHYLRLFGEHVPVDEKPELLAEAADDFFGGDIYALIERYFALVGDMINQTDADIIGHFDLISKFNENGKLFDPEHPKYREAWQHAADGLIQAQRIFEINTGAMSRGYRTAPYPSDEMIRYIAERGGRFIFSGDAHSIETIGYHFKDLSEKWQWIQSVNLSELCPRKNFQH